MLTLRDAKRRDGLMATGARVVPSANGTRVHHTSVACATAWSFGIAVHAQRPEEAPV